MITAAHLSPAVSPTATILQFPLQRRLAGRLPEGMAPPCGFTLQDRAALHNWINHAGAARYGRVVIEPGLPDTGPHCASYALVYCQNDPWSRWGLARNGQAITVWCSRTGTDCGEWPTMAEALATL